MQESTATLCSTSPLCDKGLTTFRRHSDHVTSNFMTKELGFKGERCRWMLQIFFNLAFINMDMKKIDLTHSRPWSVDWLS